MGRIVQPLPGHLWLELADERDRQDRKWGGVPGIERRDDHTYAAVLGEEFGEVCKSWLERDVENLRAELVQTAAVCIAWIAELDNGGALPRPFAAPERDAELSNIGTAS
jgi:NTP pyrophosphatase (non-canonical NTP hydrolase)